MKQTYIFFLLFISLFSSAQIINFPDANFKAKLLESNSSNYIARDIEWNSIKIDINNNNEIEISEALNVYELNVSNVSSPINIKISEITGLNYFTNLSKFYCYDNLLINLDLTQFIDLEGVGCDNNLIANLNVTGLNNLKFIMCENNEITVLDLNNKSQMEFLYCSGNNIVNLDLSDLTNLNNITTNNNNLTELNLNGLYLLQDIQCANTNINVLDVSGQTNLTTLLCPNNLSLEYIFMKNGSIETGLSISNLPNLKYICVDENQISTIQNHINLSNNSIGNVNTYCSFTPGGQYYIVQGQNKLDNENDGCDITDGFIPNLKYSITDGTIAGSIISNNTGNYSIPVQIGTHTITPILENPSYFNVSPTNVVVDFPPQTSPFTQDFCITPNGEIHDVEISILPTNPARPGFDCNYKIIYKNKGNETESGVINLQFNDAVLDLVSTNPVFAIQTMNNLTFNYNNLQPFETREITVVFNVNSPMESPAVNSGDILNYTATNTIVDTDEMTSDNTFVLNQTVVNSYDPNDKTCLQGNYVTPDKIGDFVHYVIRFENTGTFPAENIVVKDMIDTAKFDVASLIPLQASHNYFTKITGNKVEFIFENINLPFDDANNDGYVAFKIKTLPSLVVGNTFSNSANIYFDYNFPIVTNTATTTIAALSNPSFEFSNYFSLYPNPTTNELNINLKSAIEINSIQIYNTIGQLVTVQTGNALKVDVSNLKTGNYFIKINTNEGFSTSQFIKE